MQSLVEPVDSSEWDQTQEKFESQHGLNLLSNTDSPESALFTRASVSASPLVADMHSRPMHVADLHSRSMHVASDAGHAEHFSHR
jgi:hypothetical protein